ncbi:MAG: sigma-54 dependent transcriptional regulator [Cellvibrionaceae bacterium]|nr:sigma-54 dependent transcriptional regulator [Cellvibrionaceae bacterium]
MSASAFALDKPLLATLLVVEDDPSLREALADTLLLANYTVITAEDAEAALVTLHNNQDIAMVVSDVNMGVLSGHDLLRQVKTHYPHIPMLLITAYASVKDSVNAMRNGAVDYLVKPFEPQALVEIVNKYVSGITSAQEGEPVAQAPGSCQLLQLAKRVAQADSTVLIIGESGTGKEVLARYVHQHSPRASGAFVAINCAAIPDNMLESILFGYEKGAYTGAYTSTAGKFEQANGGTLLLDEISEMPLGLQAKLLRVIQEREVERLGGRKPIALDVRIIATSNRNMSEQVAEGNFREDLYYRLNVLPLFWQPLRERKEDILPLAHKLLHKHALKQNRLGALFTESAQTALLDYHWPGNVRELDNVVQRALILQAGLQITDRDLGLSIDTAILGNTTVDHATTHDQSAVVEPRCFSAKPANVSDSRVDTVFPGAPQLGDDLKQREFEIIVKTLRQERGSRKHTAKRLGISPRTLRYKIAKMRDLGLEVP